MGRDRSPTKGGAHMQKPMTASQAVAGGDGEQESPQIPQPGVGRKHGRTREVLRISAGIPEKNRIQEIDPGRKGNQTMMS